MLWQCNTAHELQTSVGCRTVNMEFRYEFFVTPVSIFCEEIESDKMLERGKQTKEWKVAMRLLCARRL